MNTRYARLIAYLGMVALLASLIVGIMGYSSTVSQIEIMRDTLLKRHVTTNIHMAMRYLQMTYGKLIQGEGTLLDKDQNTIEGSVRVVDSILEDLGDHATIFVRIGDNFQRLSTTIANDDERIVGTWLGKEHNAYEYAITGRTYIGEAEIMGVNYYTAYSPITDQNYNVIGLLFVGTPMAALDEMMEVHNQTRSRIDISIIVMRAIALGALIFLISYSLIEQGRLRKNSQEKNQIDSTQSETRQ